MKFSNIFIALLLILIAACKGNKSNDDHGHDHGPDSHSHSPSEMPTETYTIWTDQTELFVEFPALTVNEISDFAAHFTILEGHQPVKDGSVTVSLIQGTKGVRQTVEAPSSPGIFTPSLQPKSAGIYQLIFELNTPKYKDRITVDSVRVFANKEEAESVLGTGDDAEPPISFLKEQAWKIEFQTAPAIEKEIYQVIPTSGVWKVAPSDFQSIVATTNGRVDFRRGNLTEGSPVSKGQVLMTISSSELATNNLSAEIRKAEADFAQAKSEYNRKKELLESKIVPKSEFEKSQRNYEIAKANLETLKAGNSKGGKQVVAPFSGFIKSIKVANGDFVEQGASLLTVTSQQSSLLEAHVSPSHASDLRDIQDIWYQPKGGAWSSLNESGGRVLSVSNQVSPEHPMLAVFARINKGVEMPEGSYTDVHVAVGNPVKAITVPESALLEHYGNYSVIVQLGGESFERREVVIGKRNGDRVEIRKGLKSGELVVSKGAYQVKMASMSGQAPAHGHSH